MKIYKFRSLGDAKHLSRIKGIIENGFYCCDFLEFNDMNEGVFIINNSNVQIDVSDKQKYNICSFSGKNALNSQLMWGHYANAGMGIAIEVDIKDFSNIKKVNYDNSKENLDTIEEILTHKSLEWAYENEFRYLSKEDIKKVHIGVITKIYFGTPYKNLINYEDIKQVHKKLKSYLELQDNLKKICNEHNIEFEDYKFI